MSHAHIPSWSLDRSPRWAAVDDDTADLLTVLADDGTLSTEAEWDLYVRALRDVAENGWQIGLAGVINPNSLRERLAGRIKPQRVGAFTHRALSAGLVEYTGNYVTSTDKRGRNGGKPARELRWIGES